MRAAVLVVLAALAGGCGGGNSDGNPGKVVHAYFEAVASGDGDAACAQLTGDARRSVVDYIAQQLPEVGATTCTQAMQAIADNLGGDEASTLKKAKVTDTKIDGDTATVSIEGATRDATLRRTDGTWYIDGGLFDF